MVDGNDKSIFKYIKPFCNDNLSIYLNDGLEDLLLLLNRYFLEYRSTLEFSDNINFGIDKVGEDTLATYIKNQGYIEKR